MHKYGIFATIAVAMLQFASAQAQQVGGRGEVMAPAGETPPQAPPAPQEQVTMPPGCQVVLVLRPNTKGPNIRITFTVYGTDIGSMEKCNHERLAAGGLINVTNVSPASIGGVRVSIILAAQDKPAMIGFPSMAQQVRAAQSVCATEEGKIVYHHYQAVWNTFPTDVITMADITTSDDPAAAKYYLGQCDATRPPSQ